MKYPTLLLTLFSILTIILWIWALADIMRAEFKKPYMKFVAIIALFIIPVFGSILYFQFKRQLVVKRNRVFQLKFN